MTTTPNLNFSFNDNTNSIFNRHHVHVHVSLILRPVGRRRHVPLKRRLTDYTPLYLRR
jgi:hypothetical protein